MELNFDGVLLKAGLIGVRVGGLMTFAPFFSSIGIPARVKVALSVAITAILYPIYGSVVPPIETLDWIHVIASEVLAGLLLGLTLQFVFDGARLAGQTIGFQMGFSLANLIDPQSQVNTVVLSIFYQLITLFFFLQLDVHHWVIRGLAKSFVYLPAGTARATPAATEELLRLAGGDVADRRSDCCPGIGGHLSGRRGSGFHGEGLAPDADSLHGTLREERDRNRGHAGLGQILACRVRGAFPESRRVDGTITSSCAVITEFGA